MPPELKDKEFDAIRQRAEDRVKARAEFNLHLGIYLLVNAAVWIVWLMLVPRELLFFALPLLVTFGWGLGVAIHGLVTWTKSGMAEVRRQMSIEREIERELHMRGIDPETALGKRKRKNEELGESVRLSEEGELISDDVYPEEDARPLRGKRGR